MEFSSCFSTRQLEDFLLGNSSEKCIDLIAEHLEQCKRCQQNLQSLDDHSDELIRSLADANADGVLQQENGSTIDKGIPLPRSNDDAAFEDSGQLLASRLNSEQVQLGKFQLRKKLGSGSFGHVFLGFDPELGREVAIKVQRASHEPGSAEVQRFFREAKSAAQLQHPSIVSVYETGQTPDGVCYLVQEFVPGRTLQSEIRAGFLEFQDSVQYLIELAVALQYAHDRGIIHRDVKPSNIILDPSGQVHLTDFGLAKSTTSNDTVTGEGQIMGTPAYMSPEQASGRSAEVDSRSDIYSLGVVMYELLTGQQPFHGKNRLLLLQVLEDEPRQPTRLNDSIPPDLETICLKAIAKQPRSRYQSANDLADDLKRFANGEPILARRIGYSERFARWCRRYPAAVIAFLTLFIGSVSAVYYLSHVSKYLVRQTARDSAEMQANMLDSINEYYSSLVEDMDIHLQENGYHIPESDLESVRPVPARFTIELGKQLQSSKQPGWNVRLYSNYPFPNRSDGGPPDEFAKQAISRLGNNPAEPIVEFTQLDDVPVVRFATARVMTESCVDCHNSHPDTPKNDWNVGDVRGVLEVIRPLAKDELRTRQGMGNAIGWIIAMTALMAAFVSAIVYATTRKH